MAGKLFILGLLGVWAATAHAAGINIPKKHRNIIPRDSVGFTASTLPTIGTDNGNTTEIDGTLEVVRTEVVRIFATETEVVVDQSAPETTNTTALPTVETLEEESIARTIRNITADIVSTSSHETVRTAVADQAAMATGSTIAVLTSTSNFVNTTSNDGFFWGNTTNATASIGQVDDTKVHTLTSLVVITLPHTGVENSTVSSMRVAGIFPNATSSAGYNSTLTYTALSTLTKIQTVTVFPVATQTVTSRAAQNTLTTGPLFFGIQAAPSSYERECVDDTIYITVTATVSPAAKTKTSITTVIAPHQASAKDPLAASEEIETETITIFLFPSLTSSGVRGLETMKSVQPTTSIRTEFIVKTITVTYEHIATVETITKTALVTETIDSIETNTALAPSSVPQGDEARGISRSTVTRTLTSLISGTDSSNTTQGLPSSVVVTMTKVLTLTKTVSGNEHLTTVTNTHLTTIRRPGNYTLGTGTSIKPRTTITVVLTYDRNSTTGTVDPSHVTATQNGTATPPARTGPIVISSATGGTVFEKYSAAMLSSIFIITLTLLVLV